MTPTESGRIAEELWDEAKSTFLNHPQEALKLLDRAEAALDDAAGDLPIRIQLTRASAAQVLSRSDDTRKALDQALAGLAENPDPRLLASAYNIRAMDASQHGRYADAVRFLQQALEQGRACGEPEVIAHLCNNLALDFIYLGETERAAEYLKESLEAWNRAKSSDGRAHALLNLGFLHEQRGESGAAIDYYHQAERLYDREQNLRGVIKTRMNMATALGNLGRTDEAIATGRSALETAREFGDPTHLAHAIDGLATLMANSGQMDGVAGMYAESLRLYEETGSVRGQALVHQHIARIHPEGSDTRHDELTDALYHAERADLKPLLVEIRRDLAHACKARGDWKDAYTHLLESSRLEKTVLSERAARHLETLRVTHEVEQAHQAAEQERIRSGKLEEALREVERLRDLAEEESRQKSMILKMAAHDLRNLAGGVRQCLEIVEEEMHSSRDKRAFEETVSMALKASKDLFDTLTELMSAAVIERGSLEIFPVLVDLTEFLEETGNEWRRRLEVKQQSLQSDIPSGLKVEADLIRLREIVDNLLSNASKFAPADTTITLSAESDADAIAIHIADQGPGISESEQDLMFRPFQTLSARPTSEEGSTGIGLHIVKTLVELHGGTVSMNNLPEGGCRFTVRLPVTRSDVSMPCAHSR